jgi:hypothetical protein
MQYVTLAAVAVLFGEQRISALPPIAEVSLRRSEPPLRAQKQTHTPQQSRHESMGKNLPVGDVRTVKRAVPTKLDSCAVMHLILRHIDFVAKRTASGGPLNM